MEDGGYWLKKGEMKREEVEMESKGNFRWRLTFHEATGVMLSKPPGNNLSPLGLPGTFLLLCLLFILCNCCLLIAIAVLLIPQGICLVRLWNMLDRM